MKALERFSPWRFQYFSLALLLFLLSDPFQSTIPFTLHVAFMQNTQTCSIEPQLLFFFLFRVFCIVPDIKGFDCFLFPSLSLFFYPFPSLPPIENVVSFASVMGLKI